MALFDAQSLRARAQRTTTLTKSANAVLRESVTASASRTSFDIFLSHSYLDSQVILGIKLALEDMGHSVYVDWIEDRQLSREDVTRETAAVLRNRMMQSKSLFYATSANASNSKWMPWELGYMDGLKSKSAILPVLLSPSSTSDYKGQEYLGIYPYINKAMPQGGTSDVLWVHESPDTHVVYTAWLNGTKPTKRG